MFGGNCNAAVYELANLKFDHDAGAVSKVQYFYRKGRKGFHKERKGLKISTFILCARSSVPLRRS